MPNNNENDLEKSQNIPINLELHFNTPIYTVEITDFLDDVTTLSDKIIKDSNKKPTVDNPLVITDSFFNNDKVKDFSNFIGQTSWNILSEQGYDMDNMSVSFSELWTQEHYKNSYMEQHTHRYGSQIVGFYFLKVPDPTPIASFYDPRIAAFQGALKEKNPSELTLASNIVNYIPKEGMFIFTNSWLAHSFSKNTSEKPFSFVHFNLFAEPDYKNNPTSVKNLCEVEII